MPPRVSRLDRRSFARALRAARRVHTPLLTLLHTPAPDARVGVVVGKKVARSAVARNLLRRRLYAALGEDVPGGAIGIGHTIVIAKPPAAAAGYDELAAALHGAYRRLGDVPRPR